MLNSNNDFIRILSRSAVAGIGFGIGRDAYKGMKKNAVPILIVLVLFVAPFVLARMATQGHDERENFLKGRLPGIGLAIMLLLCLLLPGIFFVVFGSSALVGALVGRKERPKRLNGFAIARANEQFLADHGIRELGGRDNALRDAAGTEMVLDDERDNEIVFRLLNRRGKRAFITHDDEGRFVQYLPAQGA